MWILSKITRKGKQGKYQSAQDVDQPEGIQEHVSVLAPALLREIHNVTRVVEILGEGLVFCLGNVEGLTANQTHVADDG